MKNNYQFTVQSLQITRSITPRNLTLCTIKRNKHLYHFSLHMFDVQEQKIVNYKCNECVK